MNRYDFTFVVTVFAETEDEADHLARKAVAIDHPVRHLAWRFVPEEEQ